MTSPAGFDAYIDSTGLSLIVRAHHQLGQLSEAVVIRSPRPAARKLLNITGVDRLVTIEQPPDTARGTTGYQPGSTDGSATG